MLPNRKSIFIKSWLWSLIGGAALVAVFWFATDITHVFQRLNSLTVFTNIILSISIVGNVLGAGLVAWRVADKHYHARMGKAMRRYWWLSLLSAALAGLVIWVVTPLTPLIVVWNLVAPLCVVEAIKPTS